MVSLVVVCVGGLVPCSLCALLVVCFAQQVRVKREQRTAARINTAGPLSIPGPGQLLRAGCAAGYSGRYAWVG